MLGRAAPSGANKEYGMSMESVERFLTALDPEHREAVTAKPREEQQRLADAWERELADDTELDTLDELSPAGRGGRGGPPRPRPRGGLTATRVTNAPWRSAARPRPTNCSPAQLPTPSPDMNAAG